MRVIRERFLAHLIDADKVEFVADRPGKRKTGFFGLGGEAELTERMFALAEAKNSAVKTPTNAQLPTFLALDIPAMVFILSL